MKKQIRYKLRAKVLKQALQIIKSDIGKPCKDFEINCPNCQTYMLISLLEDHIEYWVECDFIEMLEDRLK